MTTKLTIELKNGIEVAMKRLKEVQQKRGKIEHVVLMNETDENDSGWSEEEYAAKPTASPSATISYDDFNRLFEAVARLKAMRKLFVDYYANPIPIKALLQLFQHGDQRNHGTIECLGFHRTSLVGDDADFRAFAAALMNDSICFKISLISCKTPETCTLGPLVDAFTTLSNLTEVNIEEMDVPGESLTLLCGLPKLRHLKLRHLPRCNLYMSSMTEALRKNHALQTIQIRYSLNEDSVVSFFRMLQENSSIQTVDIDMDCWNLYGQALGSALKVNNTMTDLELNIFGDDENIEENAELIAESLEENQSLRRLCLTFHKPRHEGDDGESAAEAMDLLRFAFAEPIEKAMRNNLSLGELLVGPVHERVYFSNLVQFILKLNRAGRKELLAPNTASRDEWVETLIRQRDDLDVLFYFLSMNPSLTEQHPVTADKVSEPRCKRLKL